MQKRAVLLTRPKADAEESAALLAARGFDTIIAPLLDIAIRAETPPLAGVQALLITSANGIRAFAQRSLRRDLAVFAVGEASARAARELGFEAVESANGDVDDLAALVRRRLQPQAGRLLHPAGSTVAGDLAAQLSHSGFGVRRYVAYTARSAHALPAAARHALKEGAVSAVLLYSPRTATIFRNLIDHAGHARDCHVVEALCLSSAVAKALAPLAFGRIRIAERPEQAALFALLPDAAQQTP